MDIPTPFSGPLAHPILSIIAAFTLSSLTLAFTRPQSIFRPALIPILVLCTIHAHLVAAQTLRFAWGGTIVSFCFVNTCHFIDVALIGRFDARTGRCWGRAWLVPAEQAPAGVEKKRADANGHQNAISAISQKQHSDPSALTKLHRAAYAMLSLRRAGSPLQVRNTPPFKSSDPSYAPTRYEALAHILKVLAANWGLQEVLALAPPPPDPASMFNAGKIPFFRRILGAGYGEFALDSPAAVGGEVGMRLVLNVAFPVGFYSNLQMVSNTWALVMLILDPGSCGDYRPYFGSWSDAYSVRRFWGKFWHQLLRGPFLAIVQTVVNGLGLQKGILRRYVELFGVFAVSGIMHEGTAVGTGMPWHLVRQGYTVQYFLTQAMGIVIEDFVEWCWGRMFGELKANEKPAIWKRALGFTWTVLFLSWSLPIWFYPMAARPAAHELGFLPVSFLKTALGR